jgi:hypothetical protein
MSRFPESPKSDDDRFPMLEKRLFGKPFLFVGLPTIGGLVDDWVYLDR